RPWLIFCAWPPPIQIRYLSPPPIALVWSEASRLSVRVLSSAGGLTGPQQSDASDFRPSDGAASRPTRTGMLDRPRNGPKLARPMGLIRLSLFGHNILI